MSTLTPQTTYPWDNMELFENFLESSDYDEKLTMPSVEKEGNDKLNSGDDNDEVLCYSLLELSDHDEKPPRSIEKEDSDKVNKDDSNETTSSQSKNNNNEDTSCSQNADNDDNDHDNSATDEETLEAKLDVTQESMQTMQRMLYKKYPKDSSVHRACLRLNYDWTEAKKQMNNDRDTLKILHKTGSAEILKLKRSLQQSQDRADGLKRSFQEAEQRAGALQGFFEQSQKRADDKARKVRKLTRENRSLRQGKQEADAKLARLEGRMKEMESKLRAAVKEKKHSEEKEKEMESKLKAAAQDKKHFEEKEAKRTQAVLAFVKATVPQETLEQELAPKSSCVICLEAKASVVFNPCGHQCLCSSCRLPNAKCPICRRYIQSQTRVYPA